MKKQNKKKIIALIVSMVFVIALSISSVTAYLIDTTDPIENTFTATTTLVDNDQFTLTETKNYQMGTEGFELVGQEKTNTGVNYTGVMPGMTIAKDPAIEIKVTTDAHIFLAVEATNMTAAEDADLYNWSIAAGWRLVATKTADDSGNTKTYYLYVLKGFTGKNAGGDRVLTQIPILSGNLVTVKNYGTADADLAAKGASLKFSAYAIQAFKIDVDTNENAYSIFNSEFSVPAFAGADVQPDN